MRVEIAVYDGADEMDAVGPLRVLRGAAEMGAWGEVRRGDWAPLLRAEAGRGATLAGVCTGTLLLAHAGRAAEAPEFPWTGDEATAPR